jgi:GDP-L-fucose synthase
MEGRKLKILITGGNGYIAKSLQTVLKDKHNAMSISRFDFDLTDREATNSFFKHRLFDVVIHCAIKGGSRLAEDSGNIIDDNLSMYYNLLANKSYFDKLIYFGSGAEIYSKDTPYGLSKHVIRQSILEKDNFYNLRIFGVFDENELDTRFIKANIKRYINKESIQIHQDKYMDFIYMPDLVKIVEYYINNNNLPKETNCIYNTVCTLTRIAQIINELDEYKVEVKVESGVGSNYNGKEGNALPINFIGLKQGIKEVYNKLKNEY